MIQLKELNSDLIYQQNQSFIITNNQQFQSTKKNEKKGHWYFEATCYTEQGLSLFGFHTNQGKVDFYGWNRLSSPSIVIHENLRTNTEERQQRVYLPFSVEVPYTVGVGIDMRRNIFTVFYKNDYFPMILNQKVKINSVNAEVRGASNPSTNENISVNFGYLNFSYSIPAFTPWEKPLPSFCTKAMKILCIKHFIYYCFSIQMIK